MEQKSKEKRGQSRTFLRKGCPFGVQGPGVLGKSKINPPHPPPRGLFPH